MNFTVSSLGPCRLHCRTFGHFNAQQIKPQRLAPTACEPARGARRSTPIRACLQKGWQEADAAAPSCSHRGAGRDADASGSMASTLTLLLALGGLTCLATAGSASAAELQDKLPHLHPVAADLNQLAESGAIHIPHEYEPMQEDFWSNILRYVSYFFSVLLGTAYTAVKPIGGFLRKPVSAVITVAAVIGLYIFVSSTVKAMLGVNQEDVLLLPPLIGGSG